MRKHLFTLTTGILLSLQAFSQYVLDGVYVKEHHPTRAVVPYPYLREADVMWSKKIWRVIDLKEKANLMLAYPLEGTSAARKSLIEVLWTAANEGTLTAYSTFDDEFTKIYTKEELSKVGGAGIDSTTYTSPDPPYEQRDTVIVRTFSIDKVVGYRIKEEWFFDKQRSVMDVRIIGIAPLIYEVDEFGNTRENALKVPIFWIYYPEARKILANVECFNRFNDAARLTYDDVFQKRLFSSYIIKESNVYDRRIEEYRQGMDALVEADRIKNDIVNFEHDLWEY
jgi:gliding motility associated protien GldN